MTHEEKIMSDFNDSGLKSPTERAQITKLTFKEYLLLQILIELRKPSAYDTKLDWWR